MNFLLDTNVLSDHLKRPSGLAHRFVQHGKTASPVPKRDDPHPALRATLSRRERGWFATARFLKDAEP